MTYIQAQKSEAGCVFCNAIMMEDGVDNLIVWRGVETFVILNRYPYTSGHLMVVPYAHQPSLEMLSAAARAEMMESATTVTQVLTRVYQPQGFNIGINQGAAAGAGIADHVHMHIVPRWGGDTNFMSAVAMTRVLPENLDDTFWRVKQAWKPDKETST
jgi:ATP adenylyltransferase